MATIRSFEDLEIWKKAQSYGAAVFKVCEENEKIRKDFSFKDQLKRAALSVSNNIAEGFEYNNNNDFYRFLRFAKGSCGEVRNCLIFSGVIGYTLGTETEELGNDFMLLGKQIGKLMAYIHSKKTKEPKKPPPVTRNSSQRDASGTTSTRNTPHHDPPPFRPLLP